MIYQLEEAPTTKTPHYQGYVIFDTDKRLSGVKKIFDRAHWEVRRGTHAEARDYCQKEPRLAGPWEFGTQPKRAGRKKLNLLDIKFKIDAGVTPEELWDDPETFALTLRNMRGIREYARSKIKHRVTKPQVIVYWGPTGVGKSRKAHEENPGAYWKDSGPWWQGYHQQATVIMDEFYGWMPHHDLLKLLDYYPLHVDVKGGHEVFNSTKIIFTSNVHPKEWYTTLYTKHPEFWGPLERRLDQILFVTSPTSGFFPPITDLAQRIEIPMLAEPTSASEEISEFYLEEEEKSESEEEQGILSDDIEYLD